MTKMPKILVIDDEDILRREIVEFLTFEGYTALEVSDGIAGIQVAMDEQPDLILCDITMPKLDGYGVLLELRTYPATMNIPFIFMTARVAQEDIRMGMNSGADDYITKPFRMQELIKAIEARLSKKEAQRLAYQEEIDQLRDTVSQYQEQRMLTTTQVAMLTHDFRNLLAMLVSSNNLMRDYGERMDRDRRLEHYERTHGSLRQLSRMMDEILFVAKMETGKLEYRPEHFNIARMLYTLVDDFMIMHSETHQLTCAPCEIEMITGDPFLLQQVAVNLISNAIKYSPAGGRVYISFHAEEDEYVFQVEDEGIGIPEADQGRLFQAFQRASNVGQVEGTGLGLAVVKHAIDLHGGSVGLMSEAGVGTRIIVRIPIVE